MRRLRAAAFAAFAIGVTASLSAQVPAEHAFVEVEATPARPFVEQTVVVTVRVGVEVAFLQSNVVPMFRQPLDVQLQLHLPWARGGDGWPAIEAPVAAAEPTPAQRAILAVDDTATALRRGDDVVRDGQTFRVFELRRWFLPKREGDVSLDGHTLRFAFATQFQDEFFGRSPLDRREAVLPGAAASFRVQPLPDEGRPADFGGIVGSLRVHAEVAPPTTTVGASVRWSVHFEGEGNLSSFAVPRLPKLDGFDVLGHLDHKSATRRTIVYDLVPTRADVAAVPAVAFPCFAPGPPAAYRSLVTDAIPLVVAPGNGGDGSVVRPAPVAVEDGVDDVDVDTARPFPWPLVIGAVVAIVGLAAAAFAVRRSRARAASQRRGAAADARRVFHAALASNDRDLVAALTTYLAARLHVAPRTVIAADLPQRLVAAGVGDGLAARAARVLDALTGARHGGRGAKSDVDDAVAVVEALEEAFVRGSNLTDSVPRGRDAP